MPTRPLLRVLLGEDSTTDARLVQMVAQRTQAVRLDVVWVPTLKDALDRLAVGDIDVVLLDLMLPDSHPTMTIERIRRDAPGVPLVVWTAVDSPDFAARALQAGA